MQRQRNMFQMKEQDKTSEKELNKMEISNVSDKELKEMVIKSLLNSGEEWKNTVRISTMR